MGAAKRRATELTEWRETLSADERRVADVSIAVYERIVRAFAAVGVCYRISLFLAAYLRLEHQIQADPVVGYINDGTDNAMISHAWVELRGKKIDLSLTMTDRPDVQLPGPLLILDRAVRPGRAAYTYHRERSEAGLHQTHEIMAIPAYRAILEQKELEHARISETAKSLPLILAYLNAAPDGLGYEQLAQKLRGA